MQIPYQGKPGSFCLPAFQVRDIPLTQVYYEEQLEKDYHARWFAIE